MCCCLHFSSGLLFAPINWQSKWIHLRQKLARTSASHRRELYLRSNDYPRKGQMIATKFYSFKSIDRFYRCGCGWCRRRFGRLPKWLVAVAVNSKSLGDMRKSANWGFRVHSTHGSYFILYMHLLFGCWTTPERRFIFQFMCAIVDWILFLSLSHTRDAVNHTKTKETTKYCHRDRRSFIHFFFFRVSRLELYRCDKLTYVHKNQRKMVSQLSEWTTCVAVQQRPFLSQPRSLSFPRFQRIFCWHHNLFRCTSVFHFIDLTDSPSSYSCFSSLRSSASAATAAATAASTFLFTEYASRSSVVVVVMPFNNIINAGTGEFSYVIQISIYTTTCEADPNTHTRQSLNTYIMHEMRVKRIYCILFVAFLLSSPLLLLPLLLLNSFVFISLSSLSHCMFSRVHRTHTHAATPQTGRFIVDFFSFCYSVRPLSQLCTRVSVALWSMFNRNKRIPFPSLCPPRRRWIFVLCIRSMRWTETKQKSSKNAEQYQRQQQRKKISEENQNDSQINSNNNECAWAIQPLEGSAWRFVAVNNFAKRRREWEYANAEHKTIRCHGTAMTRWTESRRRPNIINNNLL